MKIITLTLNPAFDVHCEAERLVPHAENLFTVTSRDAGGKGVNISRALNEWGTESTPIVVLGRENCEDFLLALKKAGLICRTVAVDGRIRENITLHTPGEPETRISFKGFSADGTLLASVFEEVTGIADGSTVLTVTGSLPKGITAKDTVPYLTALKERGVRIVIDSRSFGTEDIAAVHPWLIKPNEEEISLYYNDEITTLDTAAKAAASLRAVSDNVMISLGAKGAALATESGEYLAEAPHVTPVSTVGAGDSSIAGFIAATAESLSADSSLALAVAFGSAACTTEGTNPPPRALITELCKTVKVKAFAS